MYHDKFFDCFHQTDYVMFFLTLTGENSMKRCLLFLIVLSTSVVASANITKIVMIDGVEYFARPNVKIRFCPDEGVKFMTRNARYLNCLGSLNANASKEELVNCFRTSILRIYNYEELRLLGLSSECLEKKYRQCKSYSIDRRGNEEGYVGTFLSMAKQFGFRGVFTKEDGISTCNDIFR